MPQPSVAVFGEVLFDCFPDGRQVLGGAPFNVAWHLTAFGAAPRFISAVGDDEPGERIRAAMRDWGMDTADLQTDLAHPTGRVEVRLQGGEPSYEIVPDSAYDFICMPKNFPGCGLLYHGSLALRQPVSAATLESLKRSERVERIFLDVNLRTPWWSLEQVRKLVTGGDWIKLNRDELALLGERSAIPSDLPAELAGQFISRYQLAGLIVTLGAAGALALTPDQPPVTAAPATGTQVMDTVGAGDAFASVVILGILHGWALPATLERAQQFASRIVGQRGATAPDPALYRPFIEAWSLPCRSG